MLEKLALWQKSLGSVTRITGFCRVNCEGYHGWVCNSALLRNGVVSTIVKMSPLSQLSARSAKFHENASQNRRLCEPIRLRVPSGRGSDALIRAHLFPIIKFAAQRPVRTSLTLLPTPLLEPATIAELKACGSLRVGFWLEGSTPALGDSDCGVVTGLHRGTLAMIGACHEGAIAGPGEHDPVARQLSSSRFHDRTSGPARCRLVGRYFLRASQPEEAGPMLSVRVHEEVSAELYVAAKRVPLQIKTSEAPYCRGYLLQQRLRESRGQLKEAGVLASAANSGNDVLGTMFINNRGEAYPSRFPPLFGRRYNPAVAG